MSNMKSVIGFDDNLSNGLQEFAPTSYAVSKMRAARTPYGLNGSVIKDVNDIFKPGLYLLGAGTEHTKNDSYVLTDSDTGYLYFLGPDPDESLKGGHVLTNKREATGVTFREILYMNQGSSNVITTRFGRYIADISNTTSNLGLHHIESIQSLYDTCPADGSKILCWVEDIALWITANRKQDLVEWHPAIRWGAWQNIGTGASGGSGGSPVGGSMSMELLEDSKEATPNTIYVSFGDYTLTLPDPSICSLGDKVRLDQWANTGRVINLDGTIDVTTTPCVNGVDQADFTWSGDNIIPDGTIFHHSTEEGLTWSAVANNTTYVIKQVSFLDDAVRYVLTTADSSVILRLCYTEVTYPFVEEAEWANITTLAGGYPIPENVNISDITRGISAAHKVHPVLITIDTDLIGCISYEFELTYDGYNQDPNTKIWVLLKSNDDETVVASIQRMVGNKVVKHTTEIENLWDKVSSLDIDPLVSRVSSLENTVVDYINVTSQVYIREHSAAMDYANEIIASAAIDHDTITSSVYSAAKAYTDSQVSPVSALASNNSSRINVTSNKVSATSSSLVALSAVVSSHVNGGHDTGHWTAAEIAGMADLTGVSSILSATSSMAKSTSTTLSSVSSSVSVHINGGKNTGHWTAEQLSSMMPSSAIPGVNTLTAGTTNVIITSGTDDATGKGDLVISVVQPVKLASSAGGTDCVINEVAGNVGTLDYNRLNLMYDAYKSNTNVQAAWDNDYTVPTAAAVARLVVSRSVTVQPGLAGVATLTTNDNRVILSSGSEDEVGQGNITIAVNVSDIESDVEEISSTVSNLSSNLNEAISTVSDISSSLDSTISTVSDISSNLDSVISDVSEHINGSNSTGHWTAEEIQGMINAGSAGIAISEGDNVSISTSDVNGITTYYISALTNADSATGDGSTLGIVATLTDIESNNASNFVVPTVRAVYNYGSDILSYTSSVSENVSAAISDINSTVNDISEAVLSSAGVHSLSPGTDNITISSNGTDFTISVNATSVALAQGASTGNYDISDIAGVVGTLDYQRLTQLYTAAKNGTNLESSWLNDYTVPTAEAVARTIAAAMPSTASDGSQVSYNDGPIYGFASNISSYVNDVSNIVSNTSSRLGVVSELVSSNDVILSSVSDVATTASTKASAVSSSLLELDSFVSEVSATVSNIDSSLTAVSSTVDSHTDLISSASDLADTASSLAASASDSVSALSDIVDGVSNTVDTVDNTVSAVSGTVDEVSNTVDTVSNTVSSVSSSVSALQSNFDVVSDDHYEVSSALDVAISSASALQEAFDTINNPTSAHIYGGNDTGHWTAGQIQGMIQAGSAGIAISEGANVTIDPITDPNTSITTYYISASPTTYSLCNGSSISGIVVASNNVISTYGNTAETSYVVPTMRAVYNMSSALNSAIGTKQAAGNYASATHSHTIANISDLQTALNGKQAAGDYALSNHSHTIANVSGLQDALNGKASTGHNHNGVYATTDHITILSSGDNVTLSSSVNGSQTTYYISASDTSYGSATGNSTTLGVVATVTEVDSDYESNYQVPTVAAVYSYGSAISSYATAVSRAVSNVDSTISAVSGTVDTVSTTAKNASNTASAAASTANAVSTDFYDTSSVVSNMYDTLDELVIHYNATSDTVSEISSTLVNNVIDSATSLQTSFEAVSTDFYSVSGNIETIVDSATSLQTSFDAVSDAFYDVSGQISTIVDSATSLQTSFEAVSTDFYQVSGNISTIEDSATSLQSSFNVVSDTVSEISSTLMSDVIESATSLQTSFEAVSTDFYYVSNDVSVIIDSATSLQSAYDATSNLVSEVSSDFYNTSSGISSHINGGSETGHWTEEELLAKINTGVTGVAISGVSNISVTNSNVNSINTFYVSAMINGVTTSGISAWVDSQGTYIQGIDATTYLESGGGPGTAIFGVVKVAKEYERGEDPFFRGYSNHSAYDPNADGGDRFVPSLKLIHKNYLPKQMAVAVNHEFFSDTSTCAAMRNKYLAWKHGGAVAPIAAHGITEIKNVWSNLSASEINVAANNYGVSDGTDVGESSGTRYLFAENCAVPTFHTFAVAISELQTSIGTGGGTPVVISQGSGITVSSSAAGSSMVYKVSGTFCDGTTQVGIVRASNAIVSTVSTNAATGSSNVAETKYIVPTMRAVWSMSSALNSAIGTKTSYNLCNGSSVIGVVKASNSIISTAGTAGNPETSYIVPTMRAVYNMSSTLSNAIAAKKTVSVVAGDNVSVASSTNGDIVSYIVSCLASGGGPGGSVDLLTSLTASDASVTNKAVAPAAIIGSFINTSLMGFSVGTITPFLNALGFSYFEKSNVFSLDEFRTSLTHLGENFRAKTEGGAFAFPYKKPTCQTYGPALESLKSNGSHAKYAKALSNYHEGSEYKSTYTFGQGTSVLYVSNGPYITSAPVRIVENPDLITWKDTCVTLPFGPVISGKTHRFVIEFGRTVPIAAGDDFPHKQYLMKPIDELLYCGLTMYNPTVDPRPVYDTVPQIVNHIYASAQDMHGDTSACVQGFTWMNQRIWIYPPYAVALQAAYMTIGVEHHGIDNTTSAESCTWPYGGILTDTSLLNGAHGSGTLSPAVGKVVVSTETGFWNLEDYWGNHANMNQILISSADCWYQYGKDYKPHDAGAIEDGEEVEEVRPPSSSGDTISDVILNSNTELEVVGDRADKYASAVSVTINSGASGHVGSGGYMKGVKIYG